MADVWFSVLGETLFTCTETGNQAPNGMIDMISRDLTIYAGDFVSFSGTGSDPDNNVPLSYLWQFGAGSGIPDSTLQDPGLVQFNVPGTYTVSFTVTDSLGLSDPTPATRVVTVLSSSPEIPQAGWSLLYVDSQELVGGNWAAVNAFDGKVDTFWHTEWWSVVPPHPHEIQIDLGQTYRVEGFRYLPRQDAYTYGTIGQYEFYVTDGVNWGSPVATGTFANSRLEKEVTFAPKTGRFIRLRALSEVNGVDVTSMAEINILGY
jgi:PKD repeat protein